MRLVEMDERGRITLPEEVRRRLRGRVFKVELVDPNTVVLRIADRGDVIKEIEGIKLAGDPRRKSGDASEAKHRYGGVKA
jgi:bifunctional DNA-binding transcriptional regulator/antitoxin component of YhaV-PrlF toxin-antitoxin module